MDLKLKTDLKRLDVNNKPDLMRQIEELVEETWLSPREAQVTVLMNQTDKYDTLSSLADDLQISHGAIYAISHEVNQKIAKSKRTLDSVQKV